jgi:hypothetical protein
MLLAADGALRAASAGRLVTGESKVALLSCGKTLAPKTFA